MKKIEMHIAHHHHHNTASTVITVIILCMAVTFFIASRFSVLPEPLMKGMEIVEKTYVLHLLSHLLLPVFGLLKVRKMKRVRS